MPFKKSSEPLTLRIPDEKSITRGQLAFPFTLSSHSIECGPLCGDPFFSNNHFPQPILESIVFALLPCDSPNLDFHLSVTSVGGNPPSISLNSNLHSPVALNKLTRTLLFS